MEGRPERKLESANLPFKSLLTAYKLSETRPTTRTSACVNGKMTHERTSKCRQSHTHVELKGPLSAGQ